VTGVQTCALPIWPGDYMVTMEGLNMRRERLPVAWYRVTVSR